MVRHHISNEDDYHDVYGVIVEWYDPQAQLLRQYVLKFFNKSHEVEMVDNKSRKLFLRRTACPEHVTLKDLYVGNRINIFGRILTIQSYADPYTKRQLQPTQQRSVVLITPDAYHVMGKIIDHLLAHDDAAKGGHLQMSRLRMVKLNSVQAEELCSLLGRDKGEHIRDNRAFVSNLIDLPLAALEIIGDDIASLHQRSLELRGKYGADNNTEPAVICGATEEVIKDLLRFFFDKGASKLMSTATFDNCTCGVIRPHAIKAGHLGKILDRILSQGYEISAMASFDMSLSSAMEFLEVYKGVVPEFRDMAEELTEGPVVALEIRAEAAVDTFRETVGPWDIEIAKELRPATLRAEFGVDRVRNAIHCTDLAEDGEVESRYFFELCQGEAAAGMAISAS